MERNAICDRCGFKYKAGQLFKDWQGLMVCQADLDKRNPQDFLKGKKETFRVPWVRPDPEPVFINAGDITPDML